MSLITAWSFSRLKDFEQCPYKAWLKYSEKRSQDHMDMTAANRGTMIHTACENYVKGEGDFIKEMKKFREYFEELKAKYAFGGVHLEEDWGFTIDWKPTGWFDANVWCRMKLDNLIEENEVTATATDYKSGKKYGNEVTHSQQGQLYSIGSFMRYDNLEVINVDLLYIDQGIITRKVYTREKAMKLLPSWNRRALRMTEATDFPPKPTKVSCMWCPYGPQNGDGSCQWGV